MTSALVTGATGLIGSHIVEHLVGANWNVRALVRTTSAADFVRKLGAEPVTGDVLDASSFRRSAAGCDVIFHTAAGVTPKGGWEAFRGLNVDGTRNAIDAAADSGARLLQMSSVAVYGTEGRYEGEWRTMDEESPWPPLLNRNYYGRSKRESEQLVLDAHRAGRVWATAVRPCVVYGRRDRQFIPRVAPILMRGVAPLIGAGKSTLPVVHAANVADGALRAALHPAAGGRAFNLTNDFPVAVRDFFELAARGLGRRIRFIHLSMPAARIVFGTAKIGLRVLTGGRLSVVSDASLGFLTRDNPFSSERARRELGWDPRVRPEDAVPEAFAWWREHH